MSGCRVDIFHQVLMRHTLGSTKSYQIPKHNFNFSFKLSCYKVITSTYFIGLSKVELGWTSAGRQHSIIWQGAVIWALCYYPAFSYLPKSPVMTTCCCTSLDWLNPFTTSRDLYRCVLHMSRSAHLIGFPLLWIVYGPWKCRVEFGLTIRSILKQSKYTVDQLSVAAAAGTHQPKCCCRSRQQRVHDSDS